MFRAESTHAMSMVLVYSTYVIVAIIEPIHPLPSTNERLPATTRHIGTGLFSLATGKNVVITISF